MRYASADWVIDYARTKPDAVALHNFDTGERRTWRELDQRVGQIAWFLRHGLGLAPGDRIVNVSDGDLRHFELQFACARAGLVWVPLNFRHTAAELGRACREMRPGLMLTDGVWGDLAREVAEATGIPTVLDWGPGGDLDQALASYLAPSDAIDPDAPLQILYTSGTTGVPKAAIVTLAAMACHALQQVEFCATAEPDSHLFQPMPLFHFGGLNTASNPILYFGGQVTVARRFICGGGRVSERLRAAYDPKGARFVPQYGGTEMGPVTSMNSQRIDKIMAGSCGQKARYIEIRLVDDAGRDVARGQPGEIWARGPGVTPGYLSGDGSIVGNDGWHRTGDVLREDEDGFFYVVDRVKDMYKSGGENVFSAEVEGVLLAHPAIAECAVIGVGDDKWGEVGLAVIVATDGHEVTLETLQAACEGRLARYKHPKHLQIVDSFPRNVTGKISKPALRAQYGGSRGV